MKKHSVRLLSGMCAAAMLAGAVPASAEKELTRENTVLYWAEKFSKTEWDDPASPVSLGSDGYLYFEVLDTLYKMDKVTGNVVTTGKMAGQNSYATTAPLYAEGMVFVGLDNGKIQAFDSETLKPLWLYTDDNGGSSKCEIVYDNGFIFTGFWNGQTSNADYVCLSVKDEDPSKTDEAKTAKWTFSSKGGFYWASPYIGESFIAVGTEDGNGSDDWSVPDFQSKGSKILSLDKATGRLIDKWDDIYGDIRSGLTYDGKNCYFTTKGGVIGKVAFGADGKIESHDEIELNTSDSEDIVTLTSTPTILDGRAYFGVNGTGWDQYNGSYVAVLDLDSFKIAYTAETAGSPQAKPVAVKGEDGYNYVYFFENINTGKIRYLKDKKGVTAPENTSEEKDASEKTHKCAPVLFELQGEHIQYMANSPAYDEETGAMYFRNDSNYIFALGLKPDSLKLSENSGSTALIGKDNVPTLVYAEGWHPAKNFGARAYVNGGLTGEIELTTDNEDITFSVDKMSKDDDMLTVTYNYGLYDASGKKPAPLTLDIPVIVTKDEHLYYKYFTLNGDVDCDGSVDIIDAVSVISYINGIKDLDVVELAGADTNSDGVVDIEDAVAIVGHVNGNKALY